MLSGNIIIIGLSLLLGGDGRATLSSGERCNWPEHHHSTLSSARAGHHHYQVIIKSLSNRYRCFILNLNPLIIPVPNFDVVGMCKLR